MIEWERCQGFPDDYTLIPWRGKPATECPDGLRYKAIGNSKAVTVVRWLGLRIQRQFMLPPSHSAHLLDLQMDRMPFYDIEGGAI